MKTWDLQIQLENQMIQTTISLNQKQFFLMFLILFKVRYVKKDKDVLDFAFSSQTFLEIPEMLETHTHKNSNF